jgi:3-hydroxypropionyl-CoA synthetase (ADP-forming)
MSSADIRSLCQWYISKAATTVPEHQVKGIARDYGIAVPDGAMVETAQAAAAVAEKLDYPVVVKAVSENLLHKTEHQAVHLNLHSAEAVSNACKAILGSFSERGQHPDGFLVEKMMPAGAEFIVGLQDDPHFGPVLMLGTGGIMVHLLDDVTFRVLPVTRQDVEGMIEEIKGKLLMRGFRGSPPLNEAAFVETLLAVAELGVDAAGLYESVDFNPVIVTETQSVAVDAKIILAREPAEGRLSAPAAHTQNIDKFFEPRTVALIGASTTPGKIGYVVADSLINHQFEGKVYPITRGRKRIFGLDSYEGLTELPEVVDLAVIVVGLALVPDILGQCRDLGIPAALIISGGGKELGGEQAELEKNIRDLAHEYGIRLIGPNCIGCFNATNRFDAFFQTHERMVRPKAGHAAFITQSGTYGCSFLEAFEHIGVTRMISYGNRVDVDEADMIAYLAQDPETKVLAAYAEGMGDGRKFLQTAREVVSTHRKPLVVYKSGRTKRSAKAAQSHTGAYGGTYGIYRGAFKQAGILAVDSFEELVAVTKALALQPHAQGPGIAMISNGAGPMVNAIDLFGRYELEIAPTLPETIEKMAAQYPPFYISKNPVDVTGSATSADYLLAMECLLEDPTVDVIMNWFVFQDTPLDEGIVGAVASMNRKSHKPILCGAAGGPYTHRLSRAIEDVGVPVFESAHLWIAAAKALVEWGKIRASVS